MRASAFKNQITLICKNHNVNENEVNIKFEENDIDLIPEYDEDTKTIIYHKKDYLKK